MADLNVSTQVFSEKIRSIVADSEALFLTLGNTTPLFVKELHENLSHLEHSYHTQGVSNQTLNELEQLFTDTKGIIVQSAHFFSQMHDRGRVLLDALTKSLDRLQNLDGNIKNIRNDSEDMALVALNALTGAIKSGTAGRAFSVITDELKRLSDQTNLLTDVLQTDSSSLIYQLSNFTEELHKLEKLQERVFSGLESKITQEFLDIEAKVKELTESLYTLIEESKSLEAPVSAVMETIQIQDIVRQSLDHILIALASYETVQADASVDTVELQAFKGQLLNLGEVIMNDVVKKLEESVLAFETALFSIQKLIRKGEKQRTLLLRGHFSSLSENSIHIVFEKAAQTLTAAEQNLSHYMSIKQTVASQGNRIADEVASLTKQYIKFDKIINRFRTVDIAARIEISKQSILRSIKNTILAMSDLINRITFDVEEAKKASSMFIDDTHNAIVEYAKTYGEELTAFSGTQKELLRAFQHFSAYREQLEQNTRDFTLFSETFLALLETQDAELAKIKQLVNQCKDVRSAFITAKESIPNDTQKMEIRNQHLKDIINKFTIYAHKQAAAEIGNFEVDSPVTRENFEIAASEVTFF